MTLYTTGEAILAALRTPVDTDVLGRLLDRRAQEIATLGTVEPVLADRLRVQDQAIQSQLGALLRTTRNQMRFCENQLGPSVLVDACR